MVSYCNAATVQAMFGGRAPPGPYHPHHHHHHSPPQHYFPPNPYPPPPGSHPVPPTATPSYPGVAVPPPSVVPPVAPNQPSHLQNFSSPHHHGMYESQWGMTPTPTESPPAWSSGATPSSSASSSSCVRGYDEWHLSSNPHYPHPHHHPMMGSFYPHHFPPHHQQHLPSQPSPPTTSSSTPSPPPPPSSSSSSYPHNNNNNSHAAASSPFKSEFGPCSSSGNQERGSSEMGGALGVPHSPDSGMAISDGVSSSGSPHIPQPSSSSYTTTSSSCLGPSSTSEGPSASLISSLYTSGGGLSSHHSHHRPTQARSPYEWMKKPSYGANPNSTTSAGASSTHSSSSNAKTRTKDKYRVVYSDTQRLELEKEFHYSRYITIRRKSELASILGLSERQVKIWFQNRRAKERKIVRKREELMNREKLQSMAVQFGGMM